MDQLSWSALVEYSMYLIDILGFLERTHLSLPRVHRSLF